MIFAQEHTSSYYAATVNHKTDYPRLKEDIRVDVCVIGAGFSGVSTALTLSERNYKVCLLEANRIGFGASGRNGGQLIGGISGEDRILRERPDLARELWDMRWRGHQIIHERVKRYEIPCDLKHGYLDVAIKPRHLRDMEEEDRWLTDQGYEFEHGMLSREETRDAVGTDAYIGALKNMGNGHLHPLNLCIGEALAAESLGAVIYEQTAALKIDHGDAVRVATAEGSVTADFVIFTGNAYQWLDMNLRSRFLPVRSYINATEPLNEQLLDVINPHDYAICDPNFVLNYFRLSADKRLLFGGRCNYYGEDPTVIQGKLRPRFLSIFPQMKDTRIDYAWGGTIAVPLNRVPQMGRIAPNVFYSHAYSGHGVNVTHLAGEVMADVVAGTMDRFDVFSAMPSVKIPGVSALGNTIVSIGVAWYKLRDMF